MKRTFLLAGAAVAAVCGPYATAGPLSADPGGGGGITPDFEIVMVGLHGPPLDAMVMDLAFGNGAASGMVTLTIPMDPLDDWTTPPPRLDADPFEDFYTMLLARADNDRVPVPIQDSDYGLIALVHDPTIRFGRRGGTIRLRRHEVDHGFGTARRPGGGGAQRLTVANDNVRQRIAA